jgi:hypothetical protein
MCRRLRICCSDCCALMTCRKSCVDRCFMRDTFAKTMVCGYNHGFTTKRAGTYRPFFLGNSWRNLFLTELSP